MPMFNNAHGLNVEEATQTNAETYHNHASSSNLTIHDGGQYSSTTELNVKYYVNNEAPRTTMKDLQCYIAEGAIHNSDERCDAPTCYPETRKAVQEDVFGWIKGGDWDEEPKKIMWVTGPAGTGKTAIAGSLAETCEEEGLLAGSFFFSSFAGFEQRRSKRFLVATLLYCMLQHEALDGIRQTILAAIDRDPSVFSKRLKDQCTVLLLRPFRKLHNRLDSSSLPKIFIIDGVDEVEADGSRNLERHEARSANEVEQIEILSTLLHAAHDPTFPFRILVCSRPERAIQEFFSTRASHISCELRLDRKYAPDRDIALFLRAKLTIIRRRYRLPQSWADQGVVQQLVESASGQFIYAATVIRFLESARTSPEVRLMSVLDMDIQQLDVNPFAQLDALYRHILTGSPDTTLAVRWLGVIFGKRDTPAFFIMHILQEEAGQAHYLLDALTSLVRVPPSDDDSSPYELYHRSLAEFLQYPHRCGSELHLSYTDESFLRGKPGAT